MYPIWFIIACNVHFFRDKVVFLDDMTRALYVIEGKNVFFFFTISEGKKIIVILKSKMQPIILHAFVWWLRILMEKEGKLYYGNQLWLFGFKYLWKLYDFKFINFSHQLNMHKTRNFLRIQNLVNSNLWNWTLY